MVLFSFYSTIHIPLNYCVRALETLFPQFFTIEHRIEEESRQNVNKEKYIVSASTRKHLMKWLDESGEMDFYHFAAAIFWDKITCIMSRYWRTAHIREDFGVLNEG
eukprot:m.80701 g.80701  ORF g.80701 m.80701 type:complete len:106 (+) comp12027_c1_seq7:1021-1338(+)